MKRESITFGLAGILFGFILGYVLSFQIHSPRVRAGDPRPADAMPSGQRETSGEEQMDQVTARIEHLKEHIAENPDNPVPLLDLGNIYFRAGYFEEAAGYYERVVEIDPRHLDARTGLGICLMQMKRSEEAREMFRGTVEIDPDQWQSWLNLGLAELAAGNDLEAAERAFAQVDRLQPGLPELQEIRRTLAERAPAAADGT